MTASESDRSPLLLVDTHTLIWMVEEATQLGARTAEALNRAGWENRIAISAITPWEIGLLVSKGRLKLGADVMEWIRAALSKPGVRLAPLGGRQHGNRHPSGRRPPRRRRTPSAPSSPPPCFVTTDGAQIRHPRPGGGEPLPLGHPRVPALAGDGEAASPRQ